MEDVVFVFEIFRFEMILDDDQVKSVIMVSEMDNGWQLLKLSSFRYIMGFVEIFR